MSTALARLRAGFPGLVSLQLSGQPLTFQDLQSLTGLTALRNLQLKDMHCQRQTFSRRISSKTYDSAFAHLTQLTALGVHQIAICGAKKWQYTTRDLQGITHLTNLQSLSVKTHYRMFFGAMSPPDVPVDGYIEPEAPCNKLSSLPLLTVLDIDSMLPDLTSLSRLQALSVQHPLEEGFPAAFSALQCLRELSITVSSWASHDFSLLSHMRSLQHLTLTMCCSPVLSGLDAWSKLASLTYVQQLDLFGMRRHDLYDCFTILAAMTQVTGVWLGFFMPETSLVGCLSESPVHLPGLQHLQELKLTVFHGVRCKICRQQHSKVSKGVLAYFQQHLQVAVVNTCPNRDGWRNKSCSFAV